MQSHKTVTQINLDFKILLGKLNLKMFGLDIQLEQKILSFEGLILQLIPENQLHLLVNQGVVKAHL